MASEAAKKAARARAKAQLDAAKAGKSSGLRPKLPLGERPKQISKLAQSLRKDPTTLTGGKYNKPASPSAAAAAAGNARAFTPPAKSPTMKKIKDAKLNATSKKVARDADYVNIADYKVQGTRTAIRGRMATDRAKTAGRAKNVELKLKKAAAAKKAK